MKREEQEKEQKQEENEEEIVCLDESFFINDDYHLTTFTFGPHLLQLYCLQSASTDFDLTGQLVWPGAMLLNDYLSKNAEMLEGCSVIELGSGVGITGVLCSRFCRQVVLTDHNEEVLKILKKNIELHSSSNNSSCCTGLAAEKLEWGNSNQVDQISKNYPGGFDLVLGADIYIETKFVHLDKSLLNDAVSLKASVPLLFDSVEQLLRINRERKCKFILAYVSRAKVMDSLVIREATERRMLINEVVGTRSVVGNLEGVIFEVILK